jgi:hypothetical protein
MVREGSLGAASSSAGAGAPTKHRSFVTARTVPKQGVVDFSEKCAFLLSYPLSLLLQ